MVGLEPYIRFENYRKYLNCKAVSINDKKVGDTFRIKVWDKNTDTVIYDSGQTHGWHQHNNKYLDPIMKKTFLNLN